MKRLLAAGLAAGLGLSGTLSAEPPEFRAMSAEFLRRAGGEEVLVTVNLSSQSWSGTADLPEGPAFREITPAVGLPVQPGGVVPERPRREVALPRFDLDPWGFRVFAR